MSIEFNKELYMDQCLLFLVFCFERSSGLVLVMQIIQGG